METVVEIVKDLSMALGGLSALCTLAGALVPGKVGAVAKAMGVDLAKAVAVLKEVP